MLKFVGRNKVTTHKAIQVLLEGRHVYSFQIDEHIGGYYRYSLDNRDKGKLQILQSLVRNGVEGVPGRISLDYFETLELFTDVSGMYALLDYTKGGERASDPPNVILYPTRGELEHAFAMSMMKWWQDERVLEVDVRKIEHGLTAAAFAVEPVALKRIDMEINEEN